MSDIVMKKINGRHGFKTSLMAGFETGFNETRQSALYCLFHMLLQSCIQMDIDADEHGEEGVPFPGMDAHIMQMVIIEHPVIDPFAGSAVIVDSLILFCPPWDRGIEADVPVRLGVDAAAIGRWGTFLLTWAGVSPAAGQPCILECRLCQWRRSPGWIPACRGSG